MASFILLAVLIGIPFLEIYVILQVGHAIGALPTVALLLATSLAGAWLLQHQGARAWRAFTTALAERRPPHREVINGTLVLLGGTLMLFPGFVTDVLGLLCLFPPTRSLTRHIVLTSAARRITTAGVIRVRSHRGPPHPEDRPGHGKIIEGEIGEPTTHHTDHHQDPDRDQEQDRPR